MRLLTFATQDDPSRPRIGSLLGDSVIDLGAARSWAQGARALPAEPLPGSLFELLHAGPDVWEYANRLSSLVDAEDPLHLKGAGRQPVGRALHEVILYPPLLRAMSLRDFYAFEAHVTSAHANRGRPVPPEWYQFPAFYFSNPHSLYAPFSAIPYPSYSTALDYELEVACVIGKAGKDIPADKAEGYIFGYTIFNDWSARDVQKAEMRVGLGPAKGKDFASSLGPWIVTPDELSDCATDRPGVYDLQMVARVNGAECSRGNWKDLHYSFGEMIARASLDTYLLPGDVIGSGTVGTGCLLELTRGEGPWLQPGDLVELEIELIGILANRVASRAAGQENR